MDRLEKLFKKIEKLYDNAGHKMQRLAVILTYIGSFAGFVLGFSIGSAQINELVGILIMAPLMGILGFLVSWITSLPLYGFGLLVEKVENLKANDSEVR